MPRILAALSILLILSACSNGPEPADPPAASNPGPAADLANGHAAGSLNGHEVDRSRWVGIGSYDTCGLSWAIDLTQDGNQVSGHFFWETVRYDLSGTIPPNGKLRKARAGKSPDFNGTPAPRFVIVNLEFGARRAVGSYAAETRGSNDCATPVELERYAAE